MKKPSIMNRNTYPALFVAWCQTLDREAVHRAIRPFLINGTKMVAKVFRLLNGDQGLTVPQLTISGTLEFYIY